MRALSIRQPYAELILRGIKRIEYRSRPTRIVGERFHIYAPKKQAAGSGQRAEEGGIWSGELSVPEVGEGQGGALPWMLELAEAIKLFGPDVQLPTGVIVGSAVIERVEELAGSVQQAAGREEEKASSWQRAAGSEQEDLLPAAGCQLPADLHLLPAAGCQLPAMYAWHLIGVERAKRLRKPTGHPQPVWFEPF
jgi:hypothetical protein